MSGGFRHEALFYAGPEEFVAATAPFIRQGVAAGEPVLVAVPPDRTRLLRAALGGDDASVCFADMAQLGRNPGRIISAWKDFVDEQGGPGRPVRGIGEPVWAQRTPEELVECQHHESLLNLAFADAPAWQLVCPYDTAALSSAVVDAARRSHPTLTECGCRAPSAEYVAPERAPTPFEGPLAPVPANAEELAFARSHLRDVRELVEERARAAGLGERRTADLVLAVMELAANSVRHAGGEGIVRVWHADATLVCEVVDDGRIERPLAGRVRPGNEELCGRGLWMANQLSDLVQIRSGIAGTVIRVHMRTA